MSHAGAIPERIKVDDDARNCFVTRFLRFLCVVDGRNRDQVMTAIGCSQATLKRHVGLARQLGCVITYDHFACVYRLTDPGPFDLRKLRQTRLAPAQQGRSRT